MNFKYKIDLKYNNVIILKH